MRINITKVNNVLREVGLAIILVGVPIGMYLNFFLLGTGWSNVVMLSGVIGIVSYRNLMSFRFPSSTPEMYLIILFHCICLLYKYSYNGLLFDRYGIFHWFAIALCISLMTIDIRRLRIYSIICLVWFISTLCVVVAWYCIINGYYKNYYEISESLDIEQKGILEAFTMSSPCVVNAITTMFVTSGIKNKTISKLPLFLILFDYYILFLLEKRTPVAITSIAIIFFLIKYKALFKVFSFQNVLVAVLGIVVFYVVSGVLVDTSLFVEKAESFWSRFVNGLGDMANGTQESGESAIARYYSRQKAFNFIWNEMHWWNFLFGAGYFSIGQLDLPVIQVYIELGIIGLAIVLYSMYKPVSTFIHANKGDYGVQWASLLCFYMVFASLNSGEPYNFNRWINITFLLFVLSYKGSFYVHRNKTRFSHKHV